MSTPIIIYILFRASLLSPNLVAGCSECLSSKAAGEQEPEAYPLGYVEDSCELRTKLAGIIDQPISRRSPSAPAGGSIQSSQSVAGSLVKDADRIWRQNSPTRPQSIS